MLDNLENNRDNFTRYLAELVEQAIVATGSIERLAVELDCSISAINSWRKGQKEMGAVTHLMIKSIVDMHKFAKGA